MTQKWFRVAVHSDCKLRPLLNEQIIFHGVNKSGSLCMTEVLRESYKQHGRSDEFFCHYGSKVTLEDFVETINQSTGHAFFVGHYLYGAACAPKRNRVLITQLRHPLPRMISCFQWLKNEHIRQHGTEEGFPSLEEFIRRGGGKAHSQIGQFGAGFGSRRDELRKLSCQELLDLSKENIERDFFLTGIAEQFEETIFLFSYLCGLPAVPPWKKDTRNKGRQLIYDIANETRDMILDVYRHDIELYNWNKKRFQENMQNVTIAGDIQEYKNVCANEYKDRIT